MTSAVRCRRARRHPAPRETVRFCSLQERASNLRAGPCSSRRPACLRSSFAARTPERFIASNAFGRMCGIMTVSVRAPENCDAASQAAGNEMKRWG